MLTLQDMQCPICGKGAAKKGRGNIILCTLHGWIEPIKAVVFNTKGRAVK